MRECGGDISYLKLHHTGELLRRVSEAYRRLASCDLCPRDCRVNRIKGESGFCGASLLPRIAAANIHRGEEPPISGSVGSGAIFFSGCSLKCTFCQNFPISRLGNGREVTTTELSKKMLHLQNRGAANINLVTPTHFLPQILAALWLAVPKGLRLPILWNSSGYEKVDALELLEGIVAIYLPDMKYSDDEQAGIYSSATDYTGINRVAVTEMARQVGNLEANSDGMAVKGLIIRHLVLPNGVSGAREVLAWIGTNLGKGTHLSLMSQYFPAGMASEDFVIGRHLKMAEYDDAMEALEKAGLENGWVQELDQERGPV